jgi:ribonuclease P protein component
VGVSSWPGAALRGASVSRSDGDCGTDRTFARASRLRARRLFLDVYERGYRVSGAYFVVFGLRGATPRSRLGITATKKFGHAVDRNRIKRVVREIFRHHRHVGDASIDVVVNVKSGAREASFGRLDADLASRLTELRRRLHA